MRLCRDWKTGQVKLLCLMAYLGDIPGDYVLKQLYGRNCSKAKTDLGILEHFRYVQDGRVSPRVFFDVVVVALDNFDIPRWVEKTCRFRTDMASWHRCGSCLPTSLMRKRCVPTMWKEKWQNCWPSAVTSRPRRSAASFLISSRALTLAESRTSTVCRSLRWPQSCRMNWHLICRCLPTGRPCWSNSLTVPA